MDYEIKYLGHGFDFSPRTEWKPEFAQIMKDQGIKALTLLGNRREGGFRAENLDFLNEVPFIEILRIIYLTIDDIKGIHFCPNLRTLEIHTYCETEIDFSVFKKLEKCFIYWRSKAKSLFDCISLKKLSIDHYSGKETDFSLFSKLVNLEELKLFNSRIHSLTGIQKLTKLNLLGLYNLRKLNLLEGIESLTCLTHLEVEGCRFFSSIEPVKNLIRLKKISFSNNGEIESIKWLKNLKELEEVFFYETTNILDGDMTPLLSLPKLRKCAFKKRKHYTHTSEEIENIKGFKT